MTTPQITDLPTPPSRSDNPELFSSKADSFLGALPQFQSEANEVAEFVGDKAEQVAADKTQTSLDRADAADSRDQAFDYAAQALDYAGQSLSSAQAAAASFDNFDDRYLGAKSTDPLVDNDGDPLQIGALYWNTPGAVFKSWSGTAWSPAPSTNAAATTFIPTAGISATNVQEAIQELEEKVAEAGGLDIQQFDASGTWTKPDTGRFARVQLWSGGGGGGKASATNSALGGAGGGYVEKTFILSDLGDTENVVIGAGGAGATGASPASGGAGGASTFGSLLQVFGGGGGVALASQVQIGIEPARSGSAISTSYSGAGISATDFVGRLGIWDGGVATNAVGGGGVSEDRYKRVQGSVYGGGAGGSAPPAMSSPTQGGVSVFGGNGGNGATATSGINGTQPGGGGGGRNGNSNGGNGAPGRCIVTVW